MTQPPGQASPSIGSVSGHAGGATILVTWKGGKRAGVTEVVDLTPVIQTYKFYRPLRDNPQLFATVKVDEEFDGGFRIVWDHESELDMSAETVENLANGTWMRAEAKRRAGPTPGITRRRLITLFA
jgi:hypothetical protein